MWIFLLGYEITQVICIKTDDESSILAGFKLYIFTYKSLRVRIESWLVGFVALRPKSTAMVIAGLSVHLTTLFPGQA